MRIGKKKPAVCLTHRKNDMTQRRAKNMTRAQLCQVCVLSHGIGIVPYLVKFCRTYVLNFIIYLQ